MHCISQPLRVFLVEDISVIRENLIEHIEEMLPAEVIAWEHSQKASVDWLQAHPEDWDIAILDLFLAEGSGLGVAFSVIEREKTQKVVVLSNYATPDIRERCKSLGVDAVFDKSTQIDELTVYMQGVADEDGKPKEIT